MRSRIDSWTGIASMSSGAKNPTRRDSELVASRPPVTRVGIDPDQALDGDVEAGLFLDLADGCVGDGLADFHASAGNCPEAVVGALDEQDCSRLVSHDG